MDRRKFLIGAGSLAAGGAAALGSGAFSSASATRSVEVNTVSDANAYVGIDGDSDYSTQTNGTLSITFGNNGEGLGLNANADTEFTDLLTVTNQGTDNVLVWVNLNELNNLSGIDLATAYLSMPNKGGGMDGGDGGPATNSQAPGTSGPTGSFGIILGPGNSADIALRIKTNDELGTFDSELGVYAAAEDSERFSSVVAEYDFSTYTPRK